MQIDKTYAQKIGAMFLFLFLSGRYTDVTMRKKDTHLEFVLDGQVVQVQKEIIDSCNDVLYLLQLIDRSLARMESPQKPLIMTMARTLHTERASTADEIKQVLWPEKRDGNMWIPGE